MALLIWFSNFDQTFPIQCEFRYTGQFSGSNCFSDEMLASFSLMQEIRTSSGYPLSISSCFIVSSSESNVVLEQIISAL